MKLLLYLVLALGSFAAVFFGVLYSTGNLNKETLERLWKGKESATVAEEPAMPDDTSQLAQALKAEQERIEKERSQLKEQQARLATAQRELDDTRRALEQLVKQLTENLDTSDANKEAAYKEIADSLKEMDGQNAADALQSWQPEEAARILSQIPARDRGDILDSMAPDKASIILQRMSELPAG